MTERQGHGFWLEEKLEKIKGWKRCEGYTNVFDLKDHCGTHIQSKCIKNTADIELGDLFRNGKKEKDFKLIVGLYDKLIEIQKGKKIPNKIQQYIEVEVDHEKWNKQFVLPDDVREYWKHWISNLVKNDYSYDSQWRHDVIARKKEWEHYNKQKLSMVNPRFKRDHKKQRRLQCAIKRKDLDSFINSVKKEGSSVNYGEREIKQINQEIDAAKQGKK